MPTITATERTRIWREQNRERYLASQKARYIANRETMVEQKRRWKQENPDHVRELAKQHYNRHKEKYLEYSRDFIKTKRGAALHNAKQARRRERLTTNIAGDKNSSHYFEILYNDPCSYCSSIEDMTIDHIVPINKGGDGLWNNLTAACRKCNASKSDKSLLEWLQLA